MKNLKSLFDKIYHYPSTENLMWAMWGCIVLETVTLRSRLYPFAFILFLIAALWVYFRLREDDKKTSAALEAILERKFDTENKKGKKDAKNKKTAK